MEVRAVSVERIESEPGRTLTVSFLATNKTAQEEEFVESLSLPADWQPVMPPTSVILGPQEKQVRIVAFQVPVSAAAGSYEVTYSLRSQRDYAIQDADTIRIIVPAVSRLALLLEEKPEIVIAGDEYRVKLRLINQGNSEQRVQIDVKSTQEFPVIVEPAQLSLASGANQEIVIKVKTDPKLSQRVRDTLLVQARGIGAEGEVTANLAISLEIIPTVTREPDLYHRLDARVELLVASEEDEMAFQTAFLGSGTLNEEGSKYIDFLFRAPDIQKSSYFGLRDEYLLNYDTRSFGLRLGDQAYGLSRLTDLYRYGRGMGFRLHQQRGVEAGAYSVDSRWEKPDRSGVGAYVSKRLNDRAEVKLNVLGKDQAAPLDYHDDLWSMEASLKPGGNANVELEYANGRSSRDGGVDDEAYRIDLTGTHRGIAYSLGKVHAGPNYFGYYSDVNYTNTALAFPITGRLGGYLSTQKWEENLDRDPLQYDAGSEKYYQAGFNYSLSSAKSLSLNYAEFRRRDLLAPAKYDFKEKSVRLGFGRHFPNLSLQAYLDWGKQMNLLADETDTTSRLTLSCSFRPSRNQYFSFFGQAGGDRPKDTRLLGGSNTLGFAGNWRPAGDLSIALNYVVNGFDSENQRISRQLYLTTIYGSRDEASWTLRFRHIDQSVGNGDTAFLLSYTVPWDLPVSKRRSIGAVKGRIYDMESSSNAGVSRVTLTAGGAVAVTNEKGEFIFPSLQPGTYSISVERSSIGLDRTTRDRLPILVEVKGGEITPMSIAVVRVARLTGRVVRYSYGGARNGNGNGKANGTANGNGHFAVIGSGEEVVGAEMVAPENATGKPSLTEVGGLGNILFELANGNEVVRRVTDSKGRFSLEGLRPGKWVLKAYEDNIPAYHHIELDRSELELKPGDSASVTVRVLPRLRPVQIVEQGVLTSQKEEE